MKKIKLFLQVSLRNKLLLRKLIPVLVFLLSVSGIFAQAVGDFGSKATGNWGTDGTNWIVCVTPGQWSDATQALVAPAATDNVWIQAGHTVTAEATGKLCKNLTVQGTVITNATSSSANSIAISGALTLAAGSDWQQGGSNAYMGCAWASVTVDNTSTIEFSGTMTGLPISTGTFTCGNLIWSAGSVGLAGSSSALALDIKGNLTINKDATTAGKIRGATTNFAGTITHTIYGDLIMNNSAATNICLTVVNSAPSPANVTVDVKGNVILNSGKISMLESSGSVAPNAALNVGGNLTIGSAAIVQFGSNAANAGTTSINIKGNVINNNVSTSGTAAGIVKNSGGGGTFTINLIGTSAQSWTGLFPVAFTSTASALNINNTAGVSLNTSTTLNGVLSLTAGKLSLGANNLTIAAGSSITGASATNYIVTDGVGTLTQSVAATTALNFPIGSSASSYDPVLLTPTTASAVAVNVGTTLPALAPANYTYNAKVWNITPVTPSSTIVTLTPSAAVATSVSDVIAQYISGSYVNTTATKSGNVYTGTFSAFSPFVTGTTDLGTSIAQTVLANVSFDGRIIRNPTNLDLQVFDTTGRLMVRSNKNINMGNNAKGIYIISSTSGTLKIVL